MLIFGRGGFQTSLFFLKEEKESLCPSLAGQGGEELPRVLRAACWYERLGQTGALPAGSRDLLLPESSTSNTSSHTIISHTSLPDRHHLTVSLQGRLLRAEGEAGQAGLPAFDPLLRGHRFAR